MGNINGQWTDEVRQDCLKLVTDNDETLKLLSSVVEVFSTCSDPDLGLFINQCANLLPNIEIKEHLGHIRPKKKRNDKKPTHEESESSVGEESNGCSDENEAPCESVNSITRGVSKVPVTGNFSRLSPYRCHLMLKDNDRGRTWMPKSLSKSDDLKVFYRIMATTIEVPDHLSQVKKQLNGILQEVTQPNGPKIIDMDYILCTIHLNLFKCYLRDTKKLGKAMKHLNIAKGCISHVAQSAWTAELIWAEGELLIVMGRLKRRQKFISQAEHCFQLGRECYQNQPCGGLGLEEEVHLDQLIISKLEWAVLMIRRVFVPLRGVTYIGHINAKEMLRQAKLLHQLMEQPRLTLKNDPVSFYSVRYDECMNSMLSLATTITFDTFINPHQFKLILTFMSIMLSNGQGQLDPVQCIHSLMSQELNPSSNVPGQSLSTHTSEEGSSMSGSDLFLDSYESDIALD